MLHFDRSNAAFEGVVLDRPRFVGAYRLVPLVFLATCFAALALAWFSPGTFGRAAPLVAAAGAFLFAFGSWESTRKRVPLLRISAGGSPKRLEVVTPGPWLFDRDTLSVAASEIAELRFRIGPRSQDDQPLRGLEHAPEVPELGVVLWIRHRTADGAQREQQVAFQVKGLDRFDEADDLVARFGQSLGLPSVNALHRERGVAELSLSRTMGAELWRPDWRLDYAAQAPVFEEPATAIRPFELTRAQFSPSLTVYKPGDLVASEWNAEFSLQGKFIRAPRVREAGAEVGLKLVLGSVVVTALLIRALNRGSASWLGLTGLVAVLLVVFGARNYRPFAAGWTLDWGRQTLVRHGLEREPLPFSDFRSLVLRGEIFRSAESDGQPATTHYRVKLHLVHAGGVVELVKSKFVEEDHVPLSYGLPFTVELARALKVPWRWEGYA